jgi:hypothetical protein
VTNAPSDQKSSWTHHVELLGLWVMWNLISVRLEIVLVSVQYRCSVCKNGAQFVLNVPPDRKSSWTHPVELLGEWVVWNLISVRLETAILSVQHKSRVCAERTIGSEIILDAPDDTPR